MQGNEYNSPYYYSNPNPGSLTAPSASAPPYSGPEYPTYTQYPPNSDPYSVPQSQQPQYNYPTYSQPSYYENNHLGYQETPYQADNGGNYDNQGGGVFYAESSYRPEQVQEVREDELNEGVYAYNGGRLEPYGSRGTVPSKNPMVFDDYGRSISFSDGTGTGTGTGSESGTRIVKAVPKSDVSDDVKNGVQKFRVKMLPEGAGSTIDVLCQIGLDGIRMLDPSTNRTLRIYPLETITRWEVLNSSIFAFWSKSSVDFEPKRIRLESNSYIITTLLDTVTAATVQFKEIGGNNFARNNSNSDASKMSDQKKGFDWMNIIKIPNEEKDHWVPDESAKKCTSCKGEFNPFNRRHHCRNCGDIFCDKCSQGRIALNTDENAPQVRVCDSCMAEVSQRIMNVKESNLSNKVGLISHEDLAKKLKEEIERNRKSSSSGLKSNGLNGNMREVECPVCTVHLQVEVPKSGSETIECGVCQNPFLVSAN